MANYKQKLTALFLTMSFVAWSLPAFAISSSQVSSVTLNGSQSKTQPTSLKLVGNANIKNGNRRLSVSLRDSDIKQTLRMFADKAGLNIIFHDSVEDKTITLDLVGVTLNDALRMVMQASDLSYFVDSDTLIIMSAEKSKEMNISKQNMMVLPVKYSDATDIAKFLNTNIFQSNRPGLSNTEIVSVDPAKNQLIIFGTQSDYEMAKKVLAMLDTPVRVTNFKVNHVTPAEMSKNLCMALVKGYSQDETGDSESDSDSNSDNDDDDNDSGSSGSGSSGSSSGLSAGDSGGKKVKLGKAKLACVTGDAGDKGNASGGSGQQGSLYSMNRNGLKVMYFETLGLVSVIGGSQDQLDTIAAYISATDIKQPMAYLEFSILELNEEGTKSFSIDWELLSQNFSVNAMDGVLKIGSGNSDKIYWATPGQNRTYKGTATLSSAITYLLENKKGKILANPKIMVTSGKESVIDLSSDYVKKWNVQTTAGTSVYQSRTPEIGKDAGIVISVTPYISKDGYIVMNLAPTYVVEKDEYLDPETDLKAGTLMSRRNLELNNIRVKDGDTLVIGGMIQEVNKETVAKIPLLGDIPGLGFFFRNTYTTKEKQELVILITPHIVIDSEDVVTTGDTNKNL